MALTAACRVSWKTAITSEVWDCALFVARVVNLWRDEPSKTKQKGKKQQPKKSLIFNALRPEKEHLMLPFVIHISG
jgi:hypothetical protein